MNVIRYVLLFLVAFYGLSSSADELEKCLSTVTTGVHRLEREEAVSKCFSNFTQTISKDACFGHIGKFKSLISSTRLYSQALNSCFYDSSAYKKIKDCTEDTKLFKIAADHDEAIFFCYQTFQETLNKEECVSTAKKLIFPAKRDYLLNHCLEN